MSERKELGKIQKAHFGFGGYQDAQFGIWFQFGSDKNSWGVGTGDGMWATEPGPYHKWTKQDQLNRFGEICVKIAKWLQQAKVESVDQLTGVPVEVTFKDNVLKEWRILEEVL